MSYNINELKKLPIQEKKEIIATLMDDVALATNANEITEEKKQFYKQRMNYYLNDKENGTAWDTLRSKYLPE